MNPLGVNTGAGMSFAGSNNKYNSFQIDGAVSNDVFGLSDSGTNGGKTGMNPISLDAIEEIQVVIAPFDVRQGGFTGGGVNAITKRMALRSVARLSRISCSSLRTLNGQKSFIHRLIISDQNLLH